MLLENSGKIFQSTDRFIAAIKQYLCFSLLKNAASPINAAQALSCSIFYTLLMKFRFALKAEVGVFFPMILLRAIEPPSPTAASGTPGEAICSQVAANVYLVQFQCESLLTVHLMIDWIALKCLVRQWCLLDIRASPRGCVHVSSQTRMLCLQTLRDQSI